MASPMRSQMIPNALIVALSRNTYDKVNPTMIRSFRKSIWLMAMGCARAIMGGFIGTSAQARLSKQRLIRNPCHQRFPKNGITIQSTRAAKSGVLKLAISRRRRVIGNGISITVESGYPLWNQVTYC